LANVNLSASVGLAGVNRSHDVEIIQRLLTQRGINPGGIDGRCGPQTVRAILHFQSGFSSRPDGRVDQNGATWRHLNSTAPKPVTHKPVTQSVVARQPVLAPISPNQILIATAPRPARETLNPGLVSASPAFMVQQLGNPRENIRKGVSPLRMKNCAPIWSRNRLGHST